MNSNCRALNYKHEDRSFRYLAIIAHLHWADEKGIKAYWRE